MKLVVATKNAHKLIEFKRILEPLGYEVLSQADIGVDIDVEETGTTFEENSMLKAKALYDHTGFITIADDSGLEIDYLGGEPGVYSARYGGGNRTDRDRCELVLEKLQGVPKEKRTARFVSVISVIFSESDQRSYRGECSGFIGFDFLGDNGFGYDPIFICKNGKTFSELELYEKNKISHRGIAIKKLYLELSKIINLKEKN